MSHHVFISYSSKDATTAKAVCQILERNRIKCWIAPRDIKAGQKYVDVIEESIKSATVFILVFSKYAQLSDWVKSELNVAFNEKCIIIPFKIDETKEQGGFRLMLSDKQWIEAYPNPEKEFDTLVRAARSLLILENSSDNLETNQISFHPKKIKNKFHYDIFISYRREGGFETAKIVQEKLKSLGYNVFLDFEDLRFGKFNEQLYTVISECKDFVVIMCPGCLDRCQNTNDWLRLEVLHAIENKRNIIPIMMHKFSWPDTMPAGMEDLKFMNVLSPNNEFFDAFIERLVSHLKSKVSIIRKIKRLWFIFAVIIMVILFFIFYNSKYEFQRQLNQITTTENFAFNDWNPWYMGLIDSTAVSINLVHQEQVKTFGELFLKDIDELEKDENTQPVVSKIQELLKTQ